MPRYRDGCYSRRLTDCCQLCFFRTIVAAATTGNDGAERSDEKSASESSQSGVFAADEAYYVAVPATEVEVENRQITIETTAGNEVSMQVEQFDEVHLASAIHQQERLDELRRE